MSITERSRRARYDVGVRGVIEQEQYPHVLTLNLRRVLRNHARPTTPSIRIRAAVSVESVRPSERSLARVTRTYTSDTGFAVTRIHFVPPPAIPAIADFPGEYVALQGERVIGHDSDLIALLDRLEGEGTTDFAILSVPEQDGVAL